jgi:hypothetical protein
MTERDFCFWLKGLLDSNPVPNSARVSRMIDLVEESDSLDCRSFVGELRRVLAPSFGADPEIPPKSVPGLIRALNTALGDLDENIPPIQPGVTRQFVRPGE